MLTGASNSLGSAFGQLASDVSISSTGVWTTLYSTTYTKQFDGTDLLVFAMGSVSATGPNEIMSRVRVDAVTTGSGRGGGHVHTTAVSHYTNIGCHGVFTGLAAGAHTVYIDVYINTGTASTLSCGPITAAPNVEGAALMVFEAVQ